jgi:MFS family permease
MFAPMRATTKPYLGRNAMSLASSVLFVVACVALFVAVTLPVNQLTQPGGSILVTPTQLHGDRSLDVPGLPEGVSVADAHGDALLSAFELPPGLRVLTELPASLTALAVAVGAWLVARVVASIEAGHPFDRRNPGRLAGVAAAVVVGGLVAPLSAGPVAAAVLDHLGLAGPDAPVGFFASVPLTPIGIALVLLAAAEAFRRGRALEDEVEGMV